MPKLHEGTFDSLQYVDRVMLDQVWERGKVNTRSSHFLFTSTILMRTTLKSLSSVFHLRRRPHPLLLTLRGAASTLATPPRNALMFDPALLEGDKPSANVAFAARKASSTDEALRQLSLALAPSDQPTVAVPPSYQRDLDELYDVLMRPLPPVPTQRDRIEKLRATEALDEAAFFAERDRSDVEQYAHRIRCLGAQGHLAAAHEVLNDMLRQQPVAPALERHGEGESEGEGTTTATVAVLAAHASVPRPDAACYAALADACARAGDVPAAEQVIKAVRRAGLRVNAPLYTSLIGAHRRATQHLDSAAAAVEVPERAAKVMGRLRREGIVEDAPLHTSIICWFLGAGLPSEAWEAYHDSRKAGVEPDAVTFTAMMVACAQGDQLEQARSLQVEMQLRHVAPTLATHNAFINVCAARAATLTELPRHKHEQLQRLNVQIDVQSAVGLAHRQLQTLVGEGHKPDAYTYLGLLRVAAGAADVPSGQLILTRMLDANVPPSVAHFHTLLRACVRGQRYAPPERTESHLRVALAAPPSMIRLGLPMDPATIDLVLQAHIAARRIYRSVMVLDDLYEAYGLVPSRAAFNRMLKMSALLRRPQLAADLIERMHARGYEPTQEQIDLPTALAVPLEVNAHPRLPQQAWSARRGYYTPTLPETTRLSWTVTKPPRLGGATAPARAPGTAFEEEEEVVEMQIDRTPAPYQLAEGASRESRRPRERVLLKSLQTRARKARARAAALRASPQLATGGD